MPPPVKVKSPSGDRFVNVSCPTAVKVALGAKVKELVAVIVICVVPEVFLLRPAIVKFPTTITVEVDTVPFSPTTVELFPPMAVHVCVAFVPAALLVQTEVVFASHVAVTPLAHPKPDEVPLLSM